MYLMMLINFHPNLTCTRYILKLFAKFEGDRLSLYTNRDQMQPMYMIENYAKDELRNSYTVSLFANHIFRASVYFVSSLVFRAQVGLWPEKNYHWASSSSLLVLLPPRS